MEEVCETFHNVGKTYVGLTVLIKANGFHFVPDKTFFIVARSVCLDVPNARFKRHNLKITQYLKHWVIL